jgi:hypothetical protein
MKKIYSLTLAGVALLGTITAQQSFVQQASGISPKQPYQPKTTNTPLAPVKNKKVSTANFQGRFDPSYSLPIARGKTVGTTGAEYGIYVDPTFVDSTVKQSFATTTTIDMHVFGQTFDPKSIIFDPAYVPLLTSTDAYYVDTVWVGGVYQRRGNTVDDTLIVEVVWGDTTATTVFGRWSYGAPLTGFGAFVTPKYATTAGVTGSKVRFTAPSTNRLTFRHVLTKADSTYMADVSDYLPIVLNGATGQLIPANNIVSVGVSFNAGGSHAMGDVSYASPTGASPGTVSGWSAIQYSQDIPVLTTVADVVDGYDDFGAGKNASTNIYKKGRYGQETGAFATALRGGFYWGYWIDFSIHFTNTVTKVNELEKNGFVLGQNVPNPFTKESNVNYSLTKDVSSAVFTVTDVMGRVVSSEKVETATGTHSVKLGAYAAGIYYYSLNIDGNVTTKKMIVE